MKQIRETLEKNLETKELDYDIFDRSKRVKICSVCGEAIEKTTYIPGLNRTIKGPVMCKCKREALIAKEKEEINKEKQLRLKRIIKNSLIDEKFRNSKFENWDFTKGNDKMYKIANKYTKRFENMKKESVGLLLYGTPGNGKTYTVACIANFLIEKMLPVICVNADSLLNRIKDTYKKWGKEVEEDVIRGLDNADLLIIDDLGTEQDTEWTRTKIYNILDSRYRNGLPLIITTNLSLMELKNRYEKRTYYRILEMCTPILNGGKNIREEKAKEKTKILKELLR
ncbi:ATP-binding protein [Clostridium sporogenes]|uniref:ATP-binding protein n=1 Tax=Clostridium sporogenes TaxID=1509 RepID=UPI0037C12AF0